VLSSNDGCVVARSQEVKDIGVSMGVPYFHIKDIVKKHDIAVFSSHFALYRDVSRRVFSVMRTELAVVEQYSIDEAFFAVDGDPEVVARRVKCAVEKQVGIPVSVAVAATKTQVKYANRMAKKESGVKVLGAAEWFEKTPQITLASIWGVGGNLELAYKRQGLVTVADFLAADPARIDGLFGLTGLRLQQELQGNSVMKLESKAAPQQSIMHSQSFQGTVSEYAVMADAVAYHVRHAVSDLRAMGQVARGLRVSIQPSRHDTFFLQGGVKEAVLPVPTADTLEFLQVAKRLLDELFVPGVPYKKAGIVLSGLSGNAVQQATLFEDVVRPEHAAVMKVVDELNLRAGREVLLMGSHLHESKWRARKALCSPDYTTRWSAIATVKA
jgi:DNA polymerase V